VDKTALKKIQHNKKQSIMIHLTAIGLSFGDTGLRYFKSGLSIDCINF